MTLEQRQKFAEGRQYWQQYVNLNGYSFRPTDEGLRALAKTTSVKAVELRKCINVFLEA